MSQGGEKTEKPTWKRLREARSKGQVAKSHDLTSALLLIASVLVLWAAGGYAGGHLASAFGEGLRRAATFEGDLTVASALAFVLDGVRAMAWALAPLFAVLFCAALATAYLQVGPLFAAEALAPNLGRLNPAENFKGKFLSSRPYLELGKTLLKLAVAASVIALTLWDSRADVVRLASQPASRVASFAAALLFEIGLKVGLAFLAIGAADFFLQRYLHLKEMRMTKQEVKEDHKQSYGNPAYKGARRQLHRQILAQSVGAVKKADVVVVNPTHLAVALEYDRATMNAPVVLAKGADLLAEQIRRAAREADVPVVADAPLAQALFELEVEDEIPEQLYEAVAEVLRWVYRLSQEREVKS